MYIRRLQFSAEEKVPQGYRISNVVFICHIKAYTCPDCGTVVLCPDRCMLMPNKIHLCLREAIYTLIVVSVKNARRPL